MNTHGVSVEILQERLDYDPLTGHLRWKAPLRKHLIGKITASLDVNGYVQVNLGGGKILKGHRIAWAMHYGEWPESYIDHINGVRNDNRISNLRCVDNRTNCENKRNGSTCNPTGCLGVAVRKRNSESRRYAALIVVNKKQITIGSFPTVEEAHEAYLTAKRKLHKGCTI